MNTPTEIDNLEERTRIADGILTRAMGLMVDLGLPFAKRIDRLLTIAVAHMVSAMGSARTAQDLRMMADNVERGAMRHLEPKDDGTAH